MATRRKTAKTRSRHLDTAKSRKPQRLKRATPAPRAKPKRKLQATTVASARSFISAAKLPDLPRRIRTATLKHAAAPRLDAGKSQSLVVGSSVVAFVEGVTEKRREDVQNSLLLAQLVAKKAVPDTNKVGDWFKVYFDALGRIGWTVHGVSANAYSAADDDLEAHEAILAVITTLLGAAAPTALLLVKSTLEALKSMNQGQPFITLFNRESQHGHAAHFQVNVVEEDGTGGASVYLVALEMQAQSTITQVLFFKFRHQDATMRHHAGRAAIKGSVLDVVGANIRSKVAQYLLDYIKEVPI